jgi:hypothetical protein
LSGLIACVPLLYLAFHACARHMGTVVTKYWERIQLKA